MKSMRDAERDGEQGEPDLAEQLPARAQVEQVVDRAEGGRDRAAEQQGRDLGRLQVDAGPATSSSCLVDEQEDAARPAGTRRDMARPPARGTGPC